VAIASVGRAGAGLCLVQRAVLALVLPPDVKKLDVLSRATSSASRLLIATPTLIFWGWLSDKIGRKPIILGGMALASITLLSALYGTWVTTLIPRTSLRDVHSHVVTLVNYVGMTYGPIGAFLAEFFRAASATRRFRCRITSATAGVEGWSRIVTTSLFLSTGKRGVRLIYPIAVPAVMFLIAIFVMPETRKHSIWEEGAIEAARSRA